MGNHLIKNHLYLKIKADLVSLETLTLSSFDFLSVRSHHHPQNIYQDNKFLASL